MMQAPLPSTMRAALVAVALACGAAGAGAQTPAAPAASDAAAKTLRPEVATPVNAAQEAVIERGRASVSLSGRDWAQAIRSLEVVVASNQFGGADQLQMVELLAKLNYQEKDYLRAVSWLRRYLQEGGSDASLRDLLPQALYLANEHKAAAEELETRIAADEAAGRTPSEQTLRLLISSHVQAKDDTGYVRALERMAMSYPKPEYWTELLSRVTKQPGFSERLWLDVYRLRLAANLMRSADEYVEMAQLALNAGYPAEALKVIDRGLSLSLLGNGKDAANHGALRERASKAAEKDSADLPRAESSARNAREGDALVNVGFVHVTAGTPAKGVPLMEQGVAKGNLRRADEARLHLGLALWQAGRKDDAVKALAEVKGNDGSANLARVWSVFVRSPAGKV
jgi:hypothetical protein